MQLALYAVFSEILALESLAFSWKRETYWLNDSEGYSRSPASGSIDPISVLYVLYVCILCHFCDATAFGRNYRFLYLALISV